MAAGGNGPQRAELFFPPNNYGQGGPGLMWGADLGRLAGTQRPRRSRGAAGLRAAAQVHHDAERSWPHGPFANEGLARAHFRGLHRMTAWDRIAAAWNGAKGQAFSITVGGQRSPDLPSAAVPPEFMAGAFCAPATGPGHGVSGSRGQRPVGLIFFFWLF